MDDRIAILGAGHLGEAVLAGLIAAGVPRATLRATALPAARAEGLRAEYKIGTGIDNREAVADAAIVLVTVPPPSVGPVLDEIGEALSTGAVLASLAAGVTIAELDQHLPDRTPAMRVMTNTAARYREAMTAIAPGLSAADPAVNAVEAVFAQVGRTVRVAEPLMDLVTAVAGSGPAFLYYLAEAMTEAATRQGMDGADADKMVRQTLLGACTALDKSGESPSELLDQVATPGGTTRAALDTLGEGGAAAVVRSAVKAALTRSRELAD